MTIAMIGQKGIPALVGGIEHSVENLSRQLAMRGHTVIVYCRSWYCDPENSSTSHKAIHRIFRPSLATKHLDAVTHTVTSTLDVLIRRADIVHFHGIGPGAATLLARLGGLRTVVTVHGLDWQRSKWGKGAQLALKFGERISATMAHRLIVSSPTLVEYFQQTHGIDPDVIVNGVNLIEPRRPNLIRKWRLKPQQFVLTVARLVPEKGLHHLVRAFPSCPEPMRLVIAGDGGHDRHYEQSLRDRAGRRVTFIGAADRELLGELYSNARLFVLPSDVEGMSMALLEAMSAGLPVLVSDIPENSWVIGKAGFTFRRGDTDDLSKTLSNLLNTPGRLTERGLAGTKITQRFEWTTIVDQLEALYRSTVA